MTFTAADIARHLHALAVSAASAPDRRPVYAAVARELGVAREGLRRRWNALGPNGQAAAIATAGRPLPKAEPAPPAADASAVREELARLLGRPEDHPLVTIAVDYRVQRDAVAADSAKAQLTKDLNRFLAEHVPAGDGPRLETPETHKARVLEWAESTIEALVEGGVEAEILTDPRVLAAVDAARAP